MQDFDKNTWHLIQNGDTNQFQTIYITLYDSLLLYTKHLGVTESDGEDIISLVFTKLWENRKDIKIEGSLKGYCFRSVKNAILNFKNSAFQKYQEGGSDFLEQEYNQPIEDDFLLSIESQDLATYIDQLTNGLPTACQNIFRMSRNEGLSYKEIAELLNISPKTVENQIGKALSFLREKVNVLVE